MQVNRQGINFDELQENILVEPDREEAIPEPPPPQPD